MSPPWNVRLGWTLLLAGWAWAVVLDPWSLSEHDPDALPGSARMAARHAQAVVLAMGFLHLAVARLLAIQDLDAAAGRLASGLTLAGTLVYSAGYLSLAGHLHVAGLIPLGAALNLLGFIVLLGAVFRSGAGLGPRAAVVVLSLGMAVDVVVGLFVHFPGLVPAGLGPEDGVGQRMLRLARVAAIALSLLVLLFPGRAQRAGDSPWPRLGLLGLVAGCAGMPTILLAATFVDLHLKYLLPLPALSATFGVLVALFLAWQKGSPLERWGWLLIAVILNVGLLVGLYAFDGPLPAPPTQEVYNGFARRLTRLAHAYCIVLGLLAILLARCRVGSTASWMLVAGTGVTLAGIALEAWQSEAPWLLAGGPALVAVALGLAWRDAARAGVPC